LNIFGFDGFSWWNDEIPHCIGQIFFRNGSRLSPVLLKVFNEAIVCLYFLSFGLPKECFLSIFNNILK